MASAALLLVPTLRFAYAVQDPSTPYWVFCLIAATAGLGGGNFASSMANINFFYPAAKKGAALGLNAAGGNLGVALIQLFLPVIVGGAGIFGLVKASEGGIHLERAAWVYAGLAVVAAARGVPLHGQPRHREVRAARAAAGACASAQTWIMAFLYIGTFGSFIGYSAAMPLLIKLNFWVPEPAPLGTGIYFAYFAFLGALVGSATRPLGGWLADRFGGARVTLGAFGGMVVVHASPCCGRSTQLHARTRPPTRRSRRDNQSLVPVVPRLLPLRLRRHRHRQRLDVQDDPGDLAHRGRARPPTPGTPERAAALRPAPSRPRPRSASSARSARSAAS